MGVADPTDPGQLLISPSQAAKRLGIGRSTVYLLLADGRLESVHIVESRMRGNPHVRFGERAEETDRPKDRHRASARLNHAAGTLAAQTGATQRELMARLGHATSAASLRYQHAAQRRDSDIAAGLDRIVADAIRTLEREDG